MQRIEIHFWNLLDETMLLPLKINRVKTEKKEEIDSKRKYGAALSI